MNDIPRPEHPRPDLEREEAWWFSLNGRWEFEIDRAASGHERGLTGGRTLAGEIAVPFCPESRLSGVGDTDFLNCVWYRRRLEIPDRWHGRQMLLHFGACDYRTTVWLNGERLGEHEGGYTPFTFEMTGRLKGGAKDELVVRAIDDSRAPGIPRGKQCPQYRSHGCLYTRTTGIWQTVWLESVPRQWVSAVRLWPNVADRSFLVQLTLGGRGPLDCTVRACAAGEQVAEASARAVAPGVVHLAVRVPEPVLWSCDNPFLYEFRVEASGPEGTDRLRTWGGLRDFRCAGSRFELNGRPLFLRTVLDQGFYPDGIYTAPSLGALEQDIRLSQSLGFNGARLHQKVFEPAFLHLCDRMGYLVFGEFGDWGGDFNSPEFSHRMLDQWTEALERDASHPCIIGWCPLNEVMQAGTQPYGRWALERLSRLTHAIDPTRPVIDTSGYYHYATDIWDCHNYDQAPVRFAAAFAPLAEGRWRHAFSNNPQQLPYDGSVPYFVSEYGGIWWKPGAAEGESWGYGDRPRGEQEFLARFEGLTRALMDNPGVAGLCYTQLTDVEQETNGLLTCDRRMKFAPESIAAVLRRRAAIEAAP